MYQVIARKYRPQTFQDVVNQEHVKTTLENAIAGRRIAHGYIFSGQRGTGKTTVARILARCLNCVQGPTNTPCGVCASCKEITGGGTVDVIEIDAASNRGINEMRELRENVRYQPARDRYKVFIVDEAHQITNEAFNALLKTIEEPPPWVVFVLCTTEAHKIPATIASRCQHFSFRSVDFEDLSARMAWICEQEGIQADAEALAVLAQAGEGSVRDSLSALDQAIACCGSQLNAADVRALLGMFSLESLEQVSRALAAADSGRMLGMVDELERNGHNLQHFSRELARYFRNLLVARIAGENSRLIAASAGQRQKLAEAAQSFSEEDLTRYLQLSLDLFRDLQFSLQPRFHLELGLVRLVQAGRLLPIEQALAQVSKSEPRLAAPAAPPAVSAPGKLKAGPSPFELDNAKKAGAPPAAPAANLPEDPRERLHAHLSEKGLTHLADAVEHSAVTVTGSELQIVTAKTYKLYLEDRHFEAAVREAFGKPLRIKISVGEAAEAPPPAAPAAAKEDDLTRRALGNEEVRRFREVFGGEVRKVRNLKE
ncbi:MAG TPA: DNA polymerase III subunit gamma/tau [Bryobacteraceae bacterium]|nr:DNA polymerase III subunit gamma/tau [Bryobacteraceae bacterium]